MDRAYQSQQTVAPSAVADILLVEDDETDAALVLRALSKGGFSERAEHVSDGVEALEYIGVCAQRDLPSLPRLILLDLNLRKLGGLHVLRQLKSDERTRSIPIVVLTSSHLAIELVESYRFGVNSYVIKPTDAEKFAQIVADIGHYWLSINELPPA